jgi:hypothetical protein
VGGLKRKRLQKKEKKRKGKRIGQANGFAPASFMYPFLVTMKASGINGRVTRTSSKENKNVKGE